VHVLPVPGHLSIERRALSDRLAVRAITFDFGNTLVRVDRAGLRAVVQETADALQRDGTITDREAFLVAWAEERDRQFREEVPFFRETEIPQRAIRVLARLRGMPVPADDLRWDDGAAAARCTSEEMTSTVEHYSDAFLGRMRPFRDATRTLERLAERGFVLGILSNWPLASTIDRFAEAEGWTPFLRSIVVSQRVGTIKPHPAIFHAAAAALGVPAAQVDEVLHVGDDWAADVVGARQAGWRTAYVRDRQQDTPLPTSERGAPEPGTMPVVPDLEIDTLADLDALIVLAGSSAT
jgi:HAD superfamily hydrolase (TIGR01549 family)